MTLDSLGNRIKRYELASRVYLPIRSYVILRLDGCHFHSFTRGLNKPVDQRLFETMQYATEYVCRHIQGCKLGYVQSDEASFLLTDFDKLNTSAWYDNQLQKIVSVAASMFTAAFNDKFNSVEETPQLHMDSKLATFDGRAFILPDSIEVMNYFLWRIQDSEKNSLSGLCQSLYSHKELLGKKGAQQQELLFQKGINWNDYDEYFKRGTMFASINDGLWEKLAAPRDKAEIFTRIPAKPL